MSTNSKRDDSTKSSTGVSKFKVDGFVAEMVIDVDEENESHGVSFEENRRVKSKELLTLPQKSMLNSTRANDFNKKNILQTDDKLNAKDNDTGSKEDELSSEKDESFSEDELAIIEDSSTSNKNQKNSKEDNSSSKDELSSSEGDENEKEAAEKESKGGNAKRGKNVKQKLEETEQKVTRSEKKPVGRPKSVASGGNVKKGTPKRSVGRPKSMETKAKTVVKQPIGKTTIPAKANPIQKSLAGRPIKRKFMDEEEDLIQSSPKRSAGRPKKFNNQEDIESKGKKKTPFKPIKAKISPPEAQNKTPKKTSDETTGYNLGSIPGLCTRIKTAKKNELRLLYKTIFHEWPSFGTMNKLVPELHQFKGFNFDKNSAEYAKRRKLLFSFVDSHISALCKILGVKVGPKTGMIANILNFLLKPNFKICEMDKTLQPVVRLERISLDTEYFSQHLNIIVKKVPSEKSSTTPLPKRTKPVLPRASHLKVKLRGKTKKNSTSPKVPSVENTIQDDVEIKSEVFSDIEDSIQQPSIRESSAVLQSTLSSSKFSDNVEKDSEITIFKTESVVDAEKKACCIYHGTDELSEETLSSEETLAERKKSKPSFKKQMMQKIKKPLVMFPNIKESINHADLQPLQRLHILLFGASEKPEQLRHNILAFGGFPFREGSEEWKQKEFLLSLLAPNTLKEYLKILCIGYADDDNQVVLISKLMQFLSAPGGITMVPDDPSPKNVTKLKTKITSVKREIKKKPKKISEKKRKGHHRKVLMDEAQVRRLEADIAREQRILAREKKSDELRRETLGRILGRDTASSRFLNNSYTIGSNVTGLTSQPVATINHDQLILSNSASKKPLCSSDANAAQVNALLQTVYKRRALKEAGVLISVPNTGTPTKLGDLENVKFMVVTANYNDLDILHHLIFMSDGTKAKVRKNILEFSGFGFDEDSEKYKKRMDFLNSLGHDISKRIAFLLGLSSFQTKIGQQDLNELIMYFLMAPSKIKHAPIKDMPQDFFRDVSKDVNLLIFKPIAPAPGKSFPSIKKKEASQLPPAILPAASPAVHSTILPNTQPIMTSDGLKLFPVQKVVLPQKSLLNSSPIPVSTGPDTASIQSLPQFILQQPLGNSISGSPSPIQPNTQIILEPVNNRSGGNTTPTVLPEQLIVQQQPEGGGPPKMFKLVKLSSDHPLSSVIGNKTLQVNSQQNSNNVQMKFGPPVLRVPTPAPVVGNAASGNILPPGIIIFKKDLQGAQAIIQNPHNVQQDLDDSIHDEEQIDDPEEVEEPSEYWSNDEEVEVLHPLASDPPTDDELFESIQEIIHDSNFEDITLRNVIDKVSAQYSDIDLSHKQSFMKECVKRIIIGT